MDSIKVRLRNKNGRRIEYKEVEIPTDAEMERIAADFHSKGVPALTTVLGWKVFYFPAATLRYSMTEVDPFTAEHGATTHHQSMLYAYCVFGHRSSDWQVTYMWGSASDAKPKKAQQIGDVVHGPVITQKLLFSTPSEQSVDEVSAPNVLLEGDVQITEATEYERNPEARRRCIKYYGARCLVCGFSFGAVYGAAADGFIHVHHLRPVSEIGEAYQVNPVEDLRPVCANCHAVIHLGGGCRTIEEARAMIDTRVLAFWATLAG